MLTVQRTTDYHTTKLCSET